MLNKEKRKLAYKQGNIPYSFIYKMRKAMTGERCPICNIVMEIKYGRDGNIVWTIRDYMPSMQHNKPISKGGTHTLDNISFICKSCNLSLQNKETPKLNNELVRKKWEELNGRKEILLVKT